ncbi:MAG: ornithine cyclodeaminase family protein [Bryobacterales bacterium]|nr:ornithine cyclodeaminase family protein [Bryobacterales bacterium]
MRSLDAAQVRRSLHWPALIEAMRAALIAFSQGAARQPLRTVTELPNGGCLFTMPAWLPHPPALGAKLVSICPSNATLGIETHQATLVMLHPSTGQTAAILEATGLTAMRTAAVSALSVEALARLDAQHLAILGTGAQARSHLDAFRHIRLWQSIRAWSPSPQRLAQFAATHNIEAASSPEHAVRNAGVILLATSSPTPVIDEAWVQPGAHVISIGAPRPTEREIDPALLHRATIVVDSRVSALAESGDIRLTPNIAIHAELGEVLARTAPGRATRAEITIFKSLGLAVEDVAAGALVLHSLSS